MRRWGARLVGVSALVVVLAGCGGEDTRYNDSQIVDRLNLEETEGGYAIDGNLFCEVDKKLLNDADEVDAAADKDELGLVIASSQGNAGVEGVPPFQPDCAQLARKKLNRLDPEPAD